MPKGSPRKTSRRRPPSPSVEIAAIEFLPDGYGVAPAETTVAYTVAAAAVDPRPVDPGDDNLPATGGDTLPATGGDTLPATGGETLPATGGDFAVLPFTAAGALSLLLGCALIALHHLMARRRAPLS